MDGWKIVVEYPVGALTMDALCGNTLTYSTAGLGGTCAPVNSTAFAITFIDNTFLDKATFLTITGLKGTNSLY